MTDCDFVLIVDDDDEIRDTISSLLEDGGHRVLCAANGQEALEAIRTGGRPCVILLDLMMPIMDGAEFRTRQLADAQIADVPVVLITAAGRQSASTVPAQAVLLKPLRLDSLLTTVEKYCPSHA